MKKILKKTLIVTCAVVFGVITTLSYPTHQAQAMPLLGTIPAGITIGAGAYTLGAVALAAGASAVGYDAYSEEINAHAKRTWEAGTDLSKESMNVMINAAIGAGNTLQAFDQGIHNSIAGAQYFSQTVGLYDLTATGGIEVSSGTTSWGNRSHTIRATQASKDIGNTQVGYFNTINGSGYLTTSSFGVSARPRDGDHDIYFRGNLLSNPTAAGKAAVIALSQKQTASAAEVQNAMKLLYPHFVFYGATNLEAIDAAKADGVSRYNEAWESMRDAGLVLPVDSITAYTGDKALKLNPTKDRYVDDAGTVYNPADVDYAFPVPRIRTDGVPVPGVYTDSPALTGNPTIDEAITKNPAIPKTTTNVRTGETVANPDIPIEYNPPITSNPPITGNPPITSTPTIPVFPPFDAPGSSGLDFTPLMMTGEIMKNKFPFSIPFDFVKQISVFNVEPESPKFNINIPEFIKLGSFVIPFKMDLSFEMFDPIANIIRWGMIIIWDIALILSLRRLLPE